MCTAIFYKSPGGGLFFGRTMDFSWPLSPSVFFCPAGTPLEPFLARPPVLPAKSRPACDGSGPVFVKRSGASFAIPVSRYRFLGIGQQISPVSFAEGVNEAGFAAAALYFPGFAAYDTFPDREDGILSVASVGVAAFLLACCRNVREAAALLKAVRIIGTKDAITGGVSPLHWILADKSGTCVAAEKTPAGLSILDNPVGVLSNSPDFSWHMENLRNYGGVSPQQEESADWNGLSLTPFGQGAGSRGLPGDFTPPSRFVRAVWLKSHTKIPAEEPQAVNAGFHILAGVSLPKGCVVTSRQADDYTQYTSLFSLRTRSCFFNTYQNLQVRCIRFPDSKNGGAVTELAALA